MKNIIFIYFKKHFQESYKKLLSSVIDRENADPTFPKKVTIIFY